MPRNKVAGKPKGSTPAFGLFLKHWREVLRKEQPDFNTKPPFLVDDASYQWTAMTTEEKKPFLQSAEADKQRFNNEMRTYVPVAVGRSGKKKKKDPNAPKRPKGAFIIFSLSVRPTIKRENPRFTSREVNVEAGRQWRYACPQTKAKFRLLGEKEKERYKRERKADKRKKEEEESEDEESEDEESEDEESEEEESEEEDDVGNEQ